MTTVRHHLRVYHRWNPPLYNSLIDKLSATEDADVIEFLDIFCIFNKLKYRRPYGSPEEPACNREKPYLLGLRVEHMVSGTNTQRANQLARLASRNDARANAPDEFVFNRDDMKKMNELRRRPWTLMNTESLQKINHMMNEQDYQPTMQ